MTLPLFTACSDDDSGDGAPEVSVATIALLSTATV